MDPLSAQPAEPSQRWRLAYRRRPDAPPLPQRDQNAAWETALISSGLPIAGLDLAVPRPRLVFGASLTVGMPAERELLDLFLVERRSVAEVRERLVASLPTGHELIEVHDVWLGAPALSGQVAAADYRMSVTLVDGAMPDGAALMDAARRLLAAAALPRKREKGDRSIPYDLRPLVAGIEVQPGEADGAAVPAPADTTPHGAPHGAPVPAPAVQLRIRTRFDPERGVGRPEEVLAALSELAGVPLAAQSITRERLLLSGEA